MSNRLFDEDESDEETTFKTNKDYAKSYNKYRQKELLKKLKDKEAGDDSESSSESDSSDDDAAAFNPKFDQEFLKTLSSLKRKDPAIYEKSTKFFEEDNLSDADSAQPKKKAKKLTIKQYEQNILMKNGGTFDEESDDDNDEKRPQSPTYNEEQKMIKDEILGEMGKIDESDDDDAFGGLFSKREKSKTEQEQDDKEQEKWLTEHEELKEKTVQEIWSNRKLSKDEKFLRDYILSNGYADKDEDEIPTYDEIVGDDDFEEKQAEFEYKYNFRFEDPDQEFIKRYPRTIDNSVRKVDTRRKEKRKERQERKEQEKKEKFQEIEMMKELKRKEIEEKVAQLKAVTGTEELNVDEMDLDGDFDPDEYDKKMQAIFNSEYYEVDEGDEKPEAPSDIEDLQVENYDEMGENDNEGAHCEDDDFNMDCDYDEAQVDQKKSFQDEMIDSTRKRKRGKRKSKFMEMLEADKPAFNPDDEKTFGEYLDEYYKLDCEDIIGDVKCRFKYVETTPCDYGLSVEEILSAKNKELNAWASLKKATQIRPEHVERNEQMIFQRKARNEALKRKILKSLYEPSDDEVEEEEKKPIVVVNNTPLAKVNNGEPGKVEEINAEKKKKKKKKKANNATELTLSSVANPSTSTQSVETENEIQPKIEKKPQVETKPNVPNRLEKPKLEKPKLEKSKLEKSNPEKPKPIKSISESRSQPSKIVAKKTPVEKFKAKHKQDKLKKVAHKTIDKKNKTMKPNKFQNQRGLSDERLKAFGINPKKFNKKEKYAAQNAKQKPVIKGSTQPKKQPPKKIDKLKKHMKNKLKKALQSS